VALLTGNVSTVHVCMEPATPHFKGQCDCRSLLYLHAVDLTAVDV